MKRAVFLDRDGVLIAPVVRDGLPYASSGLSEMTVLPGVQEACRQLRRRGYMLIMVTNQPDIARGQQRENVVKAMNTELARRLGLDDVRLCPHDERDQCYCRKPAPGLLCDAAREHGIDLRRSFLVGDRWRDVGAGQRAGCITIFVDRGYAESKPQGADAVVADLTEASEWIFDHDSPEGENGRARAHELGHQGLR